MVHYQRYHPLKKGGVDVFAEGDEESQSIVGLIWGNTDSFGHGDESLIADLDVNKPLCSSISNGTICCDRSSIRSDICIMKGDVRTHSLSSSVFLYSSTHPNDLIDYAPVVAEDDKEEELQHEKVRPYTRKWEAGTMATIDELNLISKREKPRGLNTRAMSDMTSPRSSSPLGGIPYGDVLSRLSDYPPIDFSNDNRTHCFPEAIVGMRIHDELTVDPSLMEGGKTIRDFRTLLDRAYWPRISSLIEDEKREKTQLNSQENPSSQPSSQTSEEVREQHWELKKPKLTILSRNGSRAITNEDFLVQMAEKIGFEVEVLRPSKTSELAQIYRSLNSSDVMVGVHGAAMTHFLFLRPGSVFIQVVPLGTEWAAETYYGDPAKKLGLKYISYKILPRESSLYDEYDKSDPVLTDPRSVSDKGWEFTKKIYLDRQNVRLNLARFRKRLVRAYDHSLAKKNQHNHLMSQ
ncbi:glycosyltransferase family 61 protein [Actinidia rufa]|uniref:Glycosyltransferase family 61 protein n=1 Tax=Actinidia rufa TaxID=165716 RepID=A0A7J0F677_9ERIC|nr:glycosyltransferase family 61 protein [Actinidia rufa]